MRTRRELKERLAEHIGWLYTSAASYDRGDTSEAKRIATAIRTLVHDTGSSRSLLTQLGIRDTMTWLSTVSISDRGFAGPPWIESPTEPGFTPVPKLPEYECRFEQWWHGAIFTVSDLSIDRSWFVLHVTNFDGGAHIDPNLPEVYKAITRGGSLKPLRINSVGAAYPDLSNPVPSALRTICTEVVTSIENAR